MGPVRLVYRDRVSPQTQTELWVEAILGASLLLAFLAVLIAVNAKPAAIAFRPEVLAELWTGPFQNPLPFSGNTRCSYIDLRRIPDCIYCQQPV